GLAGLVGLRRLASLAAPVSQARLARPEGLAGLQRHLCQANLAGLGVQYRPWLHPYQVDPARLVGQGLRVRPSVRASPAGRARRQFRPVREGPQAHLPRLYRAALAGRARRVLLEALQVLLDPQYLWG